MHVSIKTNVETCVRAVIKSINKMATSRRGAISPLNTADSPPPTSPDGDTVRSTLLYCTPARPNNTSTKNYPNDCMYRINITEKEKLSICLHVIIKSRWPHKVWCFRYQFYNQNGMYGKKNYAASKEEPAAAGAKSNAGAFAGGAAAGSDGYTEAQQQQYSKYLKQLKTEFDSRWCKTAQFSITTSDLERVRTLGTGAFGRVVLLKHTKSYKYYAMKVLEKEKIVKMKQVDHTLYEKRILEAIRFPFTVSMEFAYKDNSYIYFVMPFVPGGEMFTHLRRMKKFEEPLAKFYASQIVLALEYLHYCNLVYRDLKPENILVDKNGYLKITDFGFCKVIQGRTWTLCGTPEYLAPELIMSKGYGFSVDWWSFGVLVFEMNAGYPPFYANEPMKTYEKIVAGKYRCPSSFSADLRDIIRNTLQVDLSKRFGVMKNGTMDFKNHKWFKGVEWEAILNNRFPPPFVPKYKSPGDTSNFERYDEEPIRPASYNRYESEFMDF